MIPYRFSSQGFLARQRRSTLWGVRWCRWLASRTMAWWAATVGMAAIVVVAWDRGWMADPGTAVLLAAGWIGTWAAVRLGDMLYDEGVLRGGRRRRMDMRWLAGTEEAPGLRWLRRLGR